MADHMGIAITGVGLVTPFGIGCELSWQRLCAGFSGVKSITRFSTAGLPVTFAATVDFYEKTLARHAPLLGARLAFDAADEALLQSRAGDAGRFDGPIFVASPPYELQFADRLELAPRDLRRHIDMDVAAWDPTRRVERFDNSFLPNEISRRYRPHTFPVTINTACASGSSAIVTAVEALACGDADKALVVASMGSVYPESIMRFALLRTLSRRNDEPERASRPFAKDRDGFVMGEGAAALVLERAEHATQRNATVLGYVSGYGESGDGFHRTRTNPNGKSIIACMTRAIETAGLSSEDIDYVSAHGTGTVENDSTEYVALSAVFGARLSGIPISSIKSSLGHSLSAAGAVQAVVSVLSLRDQMIPPTINCNPQDPLIPLDVVSERGRAHSIRHVMFNSFGFGGQNVSIVLSSAKRV